MIQPHEPAILDLGIISLHDAIRRVAARVLETPGESEATQFRRVGHLMQIAVALAGEGTGLPRAEFRDIPAVAGPGDTAEVFSVNLTDLLAARGSDYLSAALEGDPEALRAFQREAERLLETEDIRLV